ncbi:MAG: hypothetical protein ACYTJ0_13625 [Planctomycetota bacterium]
MRTRLTSKGWIGLLIAAAAGAYALLTGPADTPARGQEPAAPPSSFEPSEKIDVEQAVDFPYDI